MNRTNRILVLNNIAPAGLDIFEGQMELGAGVSNPTAIIVRSAKVETNSYPDLVAVARAGAGVNNISVEQATESGVCVYNTPGANANAVAELVFTMLGVHFRKVPQALDFMKSVIGDDEKISSRVEFQKSQFSGFELAGKTLGVIGLGKIGVLVANAGVQKGMKVIGYDPFPTFANMHQLDPRVEVVRQMEEVLPAADVLSVHVPFSAKTKHLIGAAQLALVNPDCVLMNYARDGIYDDAVVLEALKAGKAEAFITDFPTQALLGQDRVICTPHLGASTAESEENCAVMAAKQLKNYLEYGVVQNSVNFPTVEAFPAQTVRVRLTVVNKDVPNMIAEIASTIAAAGINIHKLVNESNGKIGYNLVDLEVDIDDATVDQIRRLPNVLKVRVLRFEK